VAVLVDNFQLTLYAAYGDPKDKTVKIEEDDTLYDCKLIESFMCNVTIATLPYIVVISSTGRIGL